MFALLFCLLIKLFHAIEYQKQDQKVLWKIFGKTCQKAGKDFFGNNQDLNSLNIIVVGKTGAGKSTLINNVFCKEFASTAIGRPETKMIQKYTKKDIPLTIYDTPGLELNLSNQKQIKKELISLINKQIKTKDPSKYIHCIWYCINLGTNRIEQTEIDFIKAITKDISIEIPIIIILTQCYNEQNKKNMIEIIEKENLKYPIVPVVAKKCDFGTFSIDSSGLDTLVHTMKDSLSDIIFSANDNGKIYSINKCKFLSYAPISLAMGVSGSIGYIPFPFGKVPALILVNTMMIKSIASIYHVPVVGDTLADIFNNTIKNAFYYGGSINDFQFPEMLIDVLNHINGGGKIVAISATGITGLIGNSYSKICEYACKAFKHPISQESLQEEINTLFEETMKNEQKKSFKNNEL